jgi:hypothetical protein
MCSLPSAAPVVSGTLSTKAGANLAADSSHLSGHLPAALDRLD